ncbi:MAG: periplasmic protein TonB [Sphingomonadales bacterium]|jgi:TonB family protein|nr:periplasmic protein TonB [Sphingomonadales bacterium]
MIRPVRAAAVAVLLLATSAAPPPPASAPPPASKGTLAELFSDADYPMAALRGHEQGKVDFRLDIDSAGEVAGCTVTHSSGSASLDEATCRLLKERARFSPARDAGGNAVPDKFDGHIIWRIDDDTAESPGFDAAAGVWMRCLAEAVRQRVAGPETAETIVAKAFDACAAEEAQLAAVGARTQSSPPAADSESMRQGMREALLQSIAAARAKPSH